MIPDRKTGACSPHSKDDTGTPSFVPVKCPVCFECIWDNEQLVMCPECGGKVCAVCCHLMGRSKAASGRKGVPCPLCRRKNFLPPNDIEAQPAPSDRERLLPGSGRSAPHRQDHRAQGLLCTARNGARAAAVVAIGTLVYLMANAH